MYCIASSLKCLLNLWILALGKVWTSLDIEMFGCSMSLDLTLIRVTYHLILHLQNHFMRCIYIYIHFDYLYTTAVTAIVVAYR